MAIDPLYQQLIMQHYRNPKGLRPLPDALPRSTRENPACGDRFSLSLILDDEQIRDIIFDGNGCAVSTASCSLMVDFLLGKNVHQAFELAQSFISSLDDSAPLLPETWGDLAALDSVRHFKSRKTCARLCWMIFRDEYLRLFPSRKETCS